MTATTDYARELKTIRSLLGLTQAEFASLLGVTQNSVMRYENGYRQVPEPTVRLARQLVRMLDVLPGMNAEDSLERPSTPGGGSDAY